MKNIEKYARELCHMVADCKTCSFEGDCLTNCELCGFCSNEDELLVFMLQDASEGEQQLLHEPQGNGVMETYKVGDFVRYINKNEIGLVGEICEDGKIRVWWHLGGTRARIDTEMVEPVHEIKEEDAGKYSNGYALRSLLHRQRILLACGIEDERLYDLIDD